MDVRSSWQRTLVYFGLAEDPDAPRTAAADAVAEHLETLERRLADNTAAIEALRAEVMRLSAKL